jgi:drug/metabolite transporter (DMT)-like permease
MSAPAAADVRGAGHGRGGEAGAVAAMVGATLLWGATFVPIRDLVRTMPPQGLVCGRFTVAALLFALVALGRRRAPRPLEWRVGIGNGVLMTASYYLQALGLRWTSAGSSAFLTCAGSLFAAFWAWVFLRERPGRELFAGIALALAGSALMSLDRSLHLGRGEIITLVGATMYALQIVWIARHGAELDALAVVGVQTATVALLVAPFSGALPAALGALSPRGWADFAYLAIAGSSIAPLFQVLAQRRLSAGRVGLLFALEPVFALVCALTLGGERFVARWWWGAGLILAAVVMVEWRAFAARREAAA